MQTTARLRVARAAALAAAAALALAFSPPAGASKNDARAANPQDATPPRTAVRDPDREICVVAQITGSRLNRRICRTQREWDADGGVPTER